MNRTVGLGFGFANKVQSRRSRQELIDLLESTSSYKI